MINLKKDYKNILLITIFVFILGISINVFAADCNGVFGKDFIPAMRNYVYTPIKWATPILLLILTSIDFAKVVFAGKKEDMDKAKNNFLKRSIAAIIIFFAPNIIDLVVSFIQNKSISACLESFQQ